MLGEAVISTTQGSSDVEIANAQTLMPKAGQYVLINGTWQKITAVDETTLTLDNAANRTETLVTKITGMNELEITGTNINLNRLTIDYFPRIS